MALIQKHPRLITALSIIMTAVAAPFLIPENPDSAVYRTGTLCVLLLFGCMQPVWYALTHADRRTLFAGICWGFLFSCALSIGSELFFYDGLLKDPSSLPRRFSVPFLMTPMLGILSTRLMIIRRGKTRQPTQIPYFVFFAAIMLMWLPVLLGHYPGMLNYDFVGEYSQHLQKSYSNIHPLLHSAVMNGIISIGERMGDPTLGVLLMSLFQMVAFAAALSYGCTFAQRHGAPLWSLVLMTLFFGLHPIFAALSVSMTKDTLFSAAVVALSLQVFEIIEDPSAYLARKRNWALFIFLMINTALMRNNGIFALALMLPALLLTAKGYRKQVILLCGSGALASVLVFSGLSAVYQPETMPSFQLYSLPAQQLVRAYNLGDMTDEERAELEGWYTSENGLILYPHLADGAKGYLDRPRLQIEGEKFLDLWNRVGERNAHEYAEALLMLNIGSWYPDDLTHSIIYPDHRWRNMGYLQTDDQDMSEYGIISRNILPSVERFYQKICHNNEYQKYPLITLLFCTATPFWVILFSCALLCARRQSRLLPGTLGALGLWLSYLFGPCTLPRYTLPLFCLAPVLLITALCLPALNKTGKELAP
ncbi:MAG: hypothetical protein IJD60_11675 [Clostridia bacterium]|nr:hypothetical protein [Clostridia bacterium]